MPPVIVMVATVKSRLVMVGLQFAGSGKAEIWIESPTLNGARSPVIESGMESTGTSISTEWRTMLSAPPAFKPGADVVIDEMDRDFDLDAGVCLEPQEIHMHGEVLDDVELVVARNGADLLAIDVDLEDGRQKMPSIDQLGRGVEIEGDGDWRLAGTVDHGRNAALTTDCTGGPLACPLAARCRKLLVGCHYHGPLESRGCGAKRKGLHAARHAGPSWMSHRSLQGCRAMLPRAIRAKALNFDKGELLSPLMSCLPLREMSSMLYILVGSFKLDLDALPMITVGAFEAKTHLSSLLDKVAAGEEAVITRHGKPVARLVAAADADRERRMAAIEKAERIPEGAEPRRHFGKRTDGGWAQILTAV